MRISDWAAWLTIWAICTGLVPEWTDNSADAGKFKGKSEPDGPRLSEEWAEPGVVAGPVVPRPVPAVGGVADIALCIADCMAGSAGGGPGAETDAAGRALVGVVAMGAAATAVVLCGGTSDELPSGVLDCELSWAALVAVTVCAAPSDDGDPPTPCAAEKWFPGFEVRFELPPPARLAPNVRDGSGMAEELAEEFAGGVAAGAASDGGGVGRGSTAKRGSALFPGG